MDHNCRRSIDKVINVCGVDIDIAQGPIGISLSGGADSAILLYILMLNHPGPMHAFTLATDIKMRSAPVYAKKVIEKCIDLTSNMSIMHHVWYDKDFSHGSMISWQDEFMRRGIYDTRYGGLTANPPIEVTSSFRNLDTELNERDPTMVRDRYHPINSHTPFANVDKRKIAEIYSVYGLTDVLFPITRSCESYEMGSGHCGECWWCEERLWAFGRLD